MSESLIGKYYLPYDNSYSVNLTSSSNYPYKNDQRYLAGTFNSDAKLCVIVSEPFICKVKSCVDNSITYEYYMILVGYNNEVISVLFNKSNVKDDKLMSNGVPIIWED